MVLVAVAPQLDSGLRVARPSAVTLSYVPLCFGVTILQDHSIQELCFRFFPHIKLLSLIFSAY